MGNGLRLVAAARKSRKGDEGSQFDRQEARNAERAERDGHTIVHTTHDVVSSQTMPWNRKELKEWMTDTNKIALYDAILVETDRLSRCDDKGWHYIEHWCYENDKKIVTTEGVIFPARDDSDRYQWLGLKRRARTYWEDVRDKHAQTRELIKANHAAIGRAPFGYKITGDKLHKTFVIDDVTGPLAKEAFVRISHGNTATSVAIWLTEQTGQTWRVKRVTDMIQRRTYLGERDGFTFEPLVTEKLWNDANAALATRSFKHTDTGGRRVEHGYSGLIYCQCGTAYYFHQSTREGKPVGQAKYRCGKGRRGDVTEKRCEHGAPSFDAVNAMVNTFMSHNPVQEEVHTTTGGDYGKKMELARIQEAMTSALANKKMMEVARLAAEYETVEARETEPVVMKLVKTGKTYGKVWRDGDLSDRRSLLERMNRKLTVKQVDGEWKVNITRVLTSPFVP